MNIVKKLKLALLATSVMLFPKAGHTMMKPEDEKPSAGPSRQLSSGPELEHPNFNSFLPASSSNQIPTATRAMSPHLTGPREMDHLFGRDFLPTEQINKQLASLRATESPEVVNALTNAIRTQIVEKFFPKVLYGRIVPYSKSSLQDIVSRALTLSNEDIEKRSNQLMRTIVDLEKAMPEDRRGYALVPNSPSVPLTEEQISQRYFQSFERLFSDTPNLMSFFTNLLDLNHNQVKNRTAAITKYANFLLPNNR
ncbi:MAG: hypothetical protein K2X28_00560 [Alphaproteobacteria bacterium]|nr:hypothetical protein [Alphaproteobacteria bacterium]